MPADKLYCLTMDYPPLKGGVARYLHELAKASQGQMEVLLPLEHPMDETLGTRHLRRVNFWWSGWPKWLPLIERCLEIKDGTVFVSHAVPVGTAAWISNLLGGPAYVVLFHGTDLQRMKTPWKRWLLRRICRRSGLLLTNSQATAKVLKNLVPGTDPLVLTPGVVPSCHCEEGAGRLTKQSTVDRHDLTAIGPRDDARSALGIPETAKLILTVCRLVERKGIDTLIQAIAQLQKGDNEIRLAVVGKGPYAQSLHQLAELLDVPVIWVEDAADEQVGQWYAAADIFCLPARETPDDVEGFGIVLLEAAAAGLPVVAGRGWGTNEAVQDGVTGWLVPPSVEPVVEALRKLLDDDDLRQKMGQAGRERVKNDFRWEDRWGALKSNIEYRISNNISERHSAQRKFDIQRSGNSMFDDIAVVIPCYNHAAELEKTLQSLVNQTLQPKEVIVVDDGSTDEPEKVVVRFADKLSIICHKLPSNQGAPAARNQGADLTTAPFLLFLDADVELKPKALEVLRRKLEENPSAAFAYSDFFWGKKLFRGQIWDAAALRRMNWIHTSSLMRRRAFPRFDESLKKFQDWDLWLTMAGRGQKGVWVDEPLFRVTERKTGYSRWLPAFMHRLPWPILGWMPSEIRRYRDAEQIIREKHGTFPHAVPDLVRNPEIGSDGFPTSSPRLLGDDRGGDGSQTSASGRIENDRGGDGSPSSALNLPLGHELGAEWHGDDKKL